MKQQKPLKEDEIRALRTVTNRYVESPDNTYFLIDYLDVSLYESTLCKFEELTGYRGKLLTKFVTPHTCVMQWGEGVTVYKGERDDPTYLRIEIKGRGMEILNNEYGLNHFRLLEIMDEIGIKNVIRCDFTMDVVGQNLVNRCHRHMKRNAWTCKAKKVKDRKRVVKYGDGESDEVETLKIGSARSDIRETIYNKAIQMREVKMANFPDDFQWTRFETTLKHNRGIEFIKKAVKAGRERWHTVGLGILYNYLDFKNIKQCEKKKAAKKCDTAAWWSELMNYQEKITWSGEYCKEIHYGTWRDKVSSQICKSLYNLIQLEGVAIVPELLEKAQSKMDEKNARKLISLLEQKIVVEDQKRDMGRNALSEEELGNVSQSVSDAVNTSGSFSFDEMRSQKRKQIEELRETLKFDMQMSEVWRKFNLSDQELKELEKREYEKKLEL